MRTVELKIEDVAFGGKGVAREAGKAVFVPFTIEHEKVEAEIVREKKKFAEAEVVSVLEPSANRVTPECPYFGTCGGCSYQHIDYAHQLAIKWRQVRDVLQRIGKLQDIPMRPIIPSPLSYAYRNRITVHVADGVIGFFRRDSHRLLDVKRCPIAMNEVNHALTELRRGRPREGHYSLRADPSGPRIFAQANDAAAAALRDLIKQIVPSNQDLLIDAYCGAGFFAKVLLDRFERVVGIDWDRFAIDAANKTATPKEKYVAGDVDRVLQDMQVGSVDPTDRGRLGSIAPTSSREDGKITLLTDPPATGLTDVTRRTILDLAPHTFIYISCNPATLARDLADFQQRFTIESVTPIDMFPQTAEIEVAVHLQKRVE
jgi:23S rRNA (uracil1939-C5)-methyltransferase